MENENASKKEVGIWDSSPKLTFALGLVAGIAIMAAIGLFAVINFLLSGKNVSALTGQPSNTQQVAAQPPQPTADPTQPTTPSAPPAAVNEKTDHILGPKDAKVTLIEYSDFECPYCLRHFDTIKQIQKDFPKDVRIIFRHFPLSFHPNAQKAAEASECAADQGKFWEMHDKIFEANRAGAMSVDKWKEIAKDLGLNTDKFNKCLDSGEKASIVSADEADGQKAGVEGTPATFINGKIVSGAIPYDSFKPIVQQAGAAK